MTALAQADQIARRSLRGNVDRNAHFNDNGHPVKCRSLRGNVDRNLSQGGNQAEFDRSFPTWERG